MRRALWKKKKLSGIPVSEAGRATIKTGVTIIREKKRSERELRNEEKDLGLFEWVLEKKGWFHRNSRRSEKRKKITRS